jgi:diamine N-acetyltransferase
MSPAIRRASEADAATLSSLASDCFTEAFGRLYAAEDLQAFLRETYAVEAWAWLLRDAGHATWLLEDGDAALGYALAGRCGLPHPGVRPEDGELKRLYLRSPVQNSGWGRSLCDTALAWLERDGPRALWVGVWSENVGAQRFYARYGFQRVGDYEFPVGRVRDHEFILRRSPRAAI